MIKEDKKCAEKYSEINKPLFTGDYRRDTSVSEYEKAAEVSQAIFKAIKNKLERNKG